MTDSRKKKLEDTVEDIDLGLTTLFGALGDAIGDMVARLEEGKTGAVNRDHVFETEKGPVRAQAGVRIQMGGLRADASRKPASGRKPATPVNPGRPPHPEKGAQPEPANPTKSVAYDLIEGAEEWMLTADLPGVSEEEVELSWEADTLSIMTTGKRRYETKVPLDTRRAAGAAKYTLRNGVLTISIPRKDDT